MRQKCHAARAIRVKCRFADIYRSFFSRAAAAITLPLASMSLR